MAAAPGAGDELYDVYIAEIGKEGSIPILPQSSCFARFAGRAAHQHGRTSLDSAGLLV
jgi:hypothetical protein